jgi:hypothetical protein
MRISRLFKRLRRWSSQAFRKRHSPAAFRTCRHAVNSVLTAEGTTSKGTGNISCMVEFCIFYRLSLRTLRTKDVLHSACDRCEKECAERRNDAHRIKQKFSEKSSIRSTFSTKIPHGETLDRTCASVVIRPATNCLTRGTAILFFYGPILYAAWFRSDQSSQDLE